MEKEITIPCDPHHWYTMCRSCKALTQSILDTCNIRSKSQSRCQTSGNRYTSSWTPRLATLQPECTTPVIFDLEGPARDLDIRSEGSLLGNAVWESLQRFIRISEDGYMRFHMSIRVLDGERNANANAGVELKKAAESGSSSQPQPQPRPRTRSRAHLRLPSSDHAVAAGATRSNARTSTRTGTLKISLLVDVPSKRPSIAAMLHALPRTLRVVYPENRKNIVSFEKGWDFRHGVSGEKGVGYLEYPGLYRLRWFEEVVAEEGPCLVWSNLPLSAQICRGVLGVGEQKGDAVYRADSGK